MKKLAMYFVMFAVFAFAISQLYSYFDKKYGWTEADQPPVKQKTLKSTGKKTTKKTIAKKVEPEKKKEPEVPVDDGKKRTDKGVEITQEEWNKAVDFIINKYPDPAFEQANDVIKKWGKQWPEKMGDFGKNVKAALHGGGFYWGAEPLEKYWVQIFEEATKKVMAGKSPPPSTPGTGEKK